MLKVIIDASLPEMSSKAREDYVLAYPIIEASPLISYDHLGADVSLWIKSRAREYLQIHQHIQHEWEVPTELDGATEAQVLDLIRYQSSTNKSTITRHDFSLAFDPISEPEKSSLSNTGSLEASAFDRNLSLIVTDIAPYVRSIVSYDARLQQDRIRLSNLLSQGGNGRGPKRMRTTRAAMSALEGGARSTTRREKYFGPDLNPHFVLKTGSQSWLEAISEISEGDGSTKLGQSDKDASSGDSEQDELA